MTHKAQLKKEKKNLLKEKRDLDKQMDLCFGRYELCRLMDIAGRLNQIEKELKK